MPQRKRIITVFIILILLLVVLIPANIFTGSVHDFDGREQAVSIIMKIRMPRLIAAAVLGGALALSGFLLQTFFLNPIVGPFVLGVSSTAKLFLAAFMVMSLRAGHLMSSLEMIMVAFAGAIFSMGLILLADKRSKNISVLVICGIMIGYICTAITDIIVTFASDMEIVNLHNWSKGSFSGTGWGNVITMVPVVLIALAGTFLLAKPMSAYRQGEEYAMSLGVDIRRFRVEIILISSILAACVTAFAGPISFLGVAVPHIIRKAANTTSPILMIPGCFLGGAAFCLFCDMIARSAFAPTELGISTVTAVFGAPVVIGVLLGKDRQ